MKKQTEMKPAAKNYNKALYTGFTIAALVFFLLKSYSEAFVMLGTALLFDPFDVNTPYDKRPAYQRWWLLVHLVAVIFLIVVMYLRK